MEYVLEMKDISKTFPGVKALDHVSFYCHYFIKLLHIGKHTIFTYGGTIFGFFTNIAFYLICTEIFCAICIKRCRPNLRKQAFSETFFTFGTLTRAAFLAFS